MNNSEAHEFEALAERLRVTVPYVELQKGILLMALSTIDVKRIEKDFNYHPPKGDQTSRYATFRNVMAEVAKQFCKMCPESRERSLALTKLEEAVMWANAAIARNE